MLTQKNSKQHRFKSKLTDGFRVSNGPVVRPDRERVRDRGEFDEVAGLPRAHGAPMLFAISRDAGTIFTYWSVDWSTIFATTIPVDRQVHLRVYRADGIHEKSVAVEPMVGNCCITVSQPGGSYYVEIGYYQPADVWNSVATSDKVTIPPDNFAETADVDLATIPFHLSFQHLLELFGAANGDDLAGVISQFQKRALNGDERNQLRPDEREILRAMALSLSEIAVARRTFIDEAGSETLRKRTERTLGFGATSPLRGFGESSSPCVGS